MKRKYEVLDYATLPSEVGHVPQIDKIAEGYQIHKKNSFTHLSSACFPEETPDLSCFVLHPAAQLSDLLSDWRLSKLRGFFISDKLKKLLETMRLCRHRFYEAELRQGKQKIKWNFMHLISDDESMFALIDFPLSRFVVSDFMGTKISPIDILSREDFEKKRRQFQKEDVSKKIAFEKVAFNEKFNPPLDLFQLPYTLDTFISGQLAEALISNHITGISIQNTQTQFELADLVATGHQ